MLRGHLNNIAAASNVEGASKIPSARIWCVDDALAGLERWSPRIPDPGAYVIQYQIGL
jgi:hypothetical protein